MYLARIILAKRAKTTENRLHCDGSLKRLLDEPYGDALVVIVAIGLAAFAAYSIARAFLNRKHAASEY